MVCRDTSELIKIVLDQDERLVDYSFQKESCGRLIGEGDLIGRWLFGKTAAAILDIDLADFERVIVQEDDLKHFLALKHFIAVQKGLAVLLGRTPGGLDDGCSVEYIDNSPAGLEMVARLRPW
ncbi:MAG: hypothetical protein R6W72_09365 [Desulfurivibrionaceae bacterium]